MNNSEITECSICMERYAEDNPPRLLSCGHVHCSLCLHGVLERGSKECAACRTKFLPQENSLDDFMVEEEILKMIGLELLPERQPA